MSGYGTPFGRQTNEERTTTYVSDAQNLTMKYDFHVHQNNRLMSQWAKVYRMNDALDKETQIKFAEEQQAKTQAYFEFDGVNKCFDECVHDVNQQGLVPAEKNCLRECYFKRMTYRSDIKFML